MLDENKPKIIAEVVADGEGEVVKDTSVLQTLDYANWLPQAAKVYHISPRIEDYVLVTSPICPSDIPNRNGIAFPLAELIAFQPPPIARVAYKAWIGCPVHLEHDNQDDTKAYGVILDTSLHKIVGFNNDKLWKVMGLLAIDKIKHPEMAERIMSGNINTYSMGALADHFTCSYCDAVCDENNHCHHISSIKAINWNRVVDHEGKEHIAFLNAHGLGPIETSIVENPAWCPALSDTVQTL